MAEPITEEGLKRVEERLAGWQRTGMRIGIRVFVTEEIPALIAEVRRERNANARLAALETWLAEEEARLQAAVGRLTVADGPILGAELNGRWQGIRAARAALGGEENNAP